MAFISRPVTCAAFRAGEPDSIVRRFGWPRSDCRDPDAVATSGGAAVVASSVVPKVVLDATCERARELLTLDRTAAPPGQGLLSDWTSTFGKKHSKTDVRPILPAETNKSLENSLPCALHGLNSPRMKTIGTTDRKAILPHLRGVKSIHAICQ